jgi:adenosylhomocysteinase
MPVLATIRERFAKERPLEGHVVAACLHVTAETANLMLALRDGGAEPVLCASNPLSTQDDVAAALVADGIAVFAIRGEDSDINAVLDHAPAITMDDGADLATILHTDRRDLEVIGSTEETTTGVIRLRAMASDGTLRVPVVAVNESATKRSSEQRTSCSPGPPSWSSDTATAGGGSRSGPMGWAPRSWSSRSTRCALWPRRWTAFG